MIRRTRTLYNLLREISVDEVRDGANRSFALVVTGSYEPTRAAVRKMLTRGATGPDVPVLDYNSREGWAPVFDRSSLVVYTLNAGQVSVSDIDLLKKMGSLGLPVVIVTLGSPALVGDTRALDDLDFLTTNSRYRIRLLKLPAQGGEDQLLRAILQDLESLDIALARRLPAFRELVSAQLINEAARANAEFALMSNIPEVIPVVGNLVTASADLLVLTKNQVLLVFKVAAAHGADINSTTRVMTEMIPVVGASFFWRSLAREMAALLPFAAGAIPKTVIAYTGTFAAGRSAQYYYSTGKAPNGELMAIFYKEAMERARRLLNNVRPKLPK